MRKAVFIFLVFLFCCCSVYSQDKTIEKRVSVSKEKGDTTLTETTIISQTEDITPRNHLLSVNPLKFFLFYNLTYYHKVEEKLVLGIGLQSPTISGMSGIGFNAELRYHPTGKNMRGFYIAPNISYNSIKADDASTNPFSIGALVGWQWFPGEQFAMGVGIGIDYYFGSVSNKNDFEKYNGTAPALRFDIGFAW
jgi:hypothetical protein